MSDNLNEDGKGYFQVMESMKTQLIIALIRRLKGKVAIPADEVAGLGTLALMFRYDDKTKSYLIEIIEKGQGDRLL